MMQNLLGLYEVSLHNMMLPHGPDKDAFEGASNADLKPKN